MSIEVLENIIEVVKNVEFYNNKLWENNNILVENKEITCNINNQTYYDKDMKDYFVRCQKD